MENNDIINSVGPCDLSIGQNNPISLKSKEGYVYRITGMDQVKDIIESGFVRPKGYGSRRERVGDKIYWSIGGKVCYYDKRPVLEAPLHKVRNGQIGAVSINDLSAIWLFDEKENKYTNRIEDIKKMCNGNNQDFDNQIKQR